MSFSSNIKSRLIEGMISTNLGKEVHSNKMNRRPSNYNGPSYTPGSKSVGIEKSIEVEPVFIA